MSKYQNCIYDTPWPVEKAFKTKDRMLMLDYESDCPSTMLSNCAWYHLPDADAKAAHAHSCYEVLLFMGSDMHNPSDLGGQITMWLNGEKKVLDKSFFVVNPSNLPHCPYTVDRIDRPMFHLAWPIDRTMKTVRMPGFPEHPEDSPRFYDANYVTELKLPETYQKADGEIPGLYVDSSVVPGCFTCGVSWYTKDCVLNEKPVNKRDYNQLLCFAGTDVKDSHNLNAEVELTIGGETYTITKTSYVFIPKGVEYGEFRIKNSTKPVLVTFTQDQPGPVVRPL